MNDKLKKLEEIYKKYKNKMYGICCRYARNSMEAQDLLHDGFIKVFEALDKYDCINSLEAWLKKIFINNCINYYKKEISKTLLNESLDDFNENDNFYLNIEPEIIEKNLKIEIILKEINSLPDGYRLVFNLYVIEGYSHKEIAEILNISESTSKTQLLKARKKLIESLKKYIKSYENV